LRAAPHELGAQRIVANGGLTAGVDNGLYSHFRDLRANHS
jgi:hypothetical protein